MQAISSYRGKRHCPPALPLANPQTGPITIHFAAKLSAQCNEDKQLVVVVGYTRRFIGVVVAYLDFEKRQKL